MFEKDYQVDMHIHTTASDGTWTTEELLQQIIKSNIKVFSVTDHDTIENSVKMLHMIPDDIFYFLGVEISCTYRDEEYHIAAYDFDYKNSRLNELLKYNQLQRKEFNTKIVQYAKEVNTLKDIKDYISYNYNKKRGGWDSLNYLYDNNVIKDFKEYFELIESSNEKLYFKHPEEIIKTIRDAGGYSILAHPSAYENGHKLSLEILKEWKNYGVSGIECFSPYLSNIEDANYYVKFCKDNNLMISAGSDCHGEFNDRMLGIPKVNMDKIELEFIKTKSEYNNLGMGVEADGKTALNNASS